jgi:hypothetical protein
MEPAAVENVPVLWNARGSGNQENNEEKINRETIS